MKEFWKKFSLRAHDAFQFIVFKHPIPSKIVLAILACLSFCLLCGWKVGVAVMLGMIIHEYGHILALDMVGIPHAGFFGVPFFGGVTIFSSEDVKKYSNQFFVAIMGPIIGTIFGGALILAYAITGLNSVGAVAGLMVAMNLSNMLPAFGLDGGVMYDSIVSGFHPLLKRISYGMMTALLGGIAMATFKLSIFVGVILIVVTLLTLIFRAIRLPEPKFEPIRSPIIVLICVVSYMATVAGMLALLYPLANVNFIEFIN